MISSQGIVVRLELPERVQQDSVVTGSLVITNKGNKAIELVTPSYHAALNLVVFDRLWNQVSANPVGKVHIAYESFELAPGQSVTFQLNGLTYNTGTARMTYRLEASVYYVVAIYHPGTGKLPLQSSYPVAVASNVVRLEVVNKCG